MAVSFCTVLTSEFRPTAWRTTNPIGQSFVTNLIYFCWQERCIDHEGVAAGGAWWPWSGHPLCHKQTVCQPNENQRRQKQGGENTKDRLAKPQPMFTGPAAATAFLFTSTGSFEQPFSSGEAVYRRRRWQQSTCQYRARCPMFRRNVKTTRLVNFTKAPTPLKRELNFRILRGWMSGCKCSVCTIHVLVLWTYNMNIVTIEKKKLCLYLYVNTPRKY